MLVNLEEGISKLEAIRCERVARYTDFQKRYSEETGVQKCGTEKNQVLTLTEQVLFQKMGLLQLSLK